MPKHDRHPKQAREPEPQPEPPIQPRGRLFGISKSLFGGISAVIFAGFYYLTPIPAQIAKEVFVKVGGQYIISNWLPSFASPAPRSPESQIVAEPKAAPKSIETGSIAKEGPPKRKRKPAPSPKEDRTFFEKLKDFFSPIKEAPAGRR